MKEVAIAIVIAAAFVGMFQVVAVHSYNTQKDYNACVQASRSLEIAVLCENDK